MVNKIISYINKSFCIIKDKLNIIETKPDIIKFIIGYIIFVFTMFLVGWFYLWYKTDTPDLQLLLKGIDTLSAPALLAVVKFVTGAATDAFNNFIDRNNNGIDDRLEKPKTVKE